MYRLIYVSTIFWWDNFDRNIETSSGAGSIHNTPGIAFQEESVQLKYRNNEVSIPKSEKRSVTLKQEQDLPLVRINAKSNPEIMIGPVPIPINPNKSYEHSEKLLVLWKIFRYLKHSNQIHPIFIGWIITQLTVMERKPTVRTYLPPIQSPITDCSTIIELCYTSRQLANQSGMQYTHITLDMGAAMKAYIV